MPASLISLVFRSPLDLGTAGALLVGRGANAVEELAIAITRLANACPLRALVEGTQGRGLNITGSSLAGAGRPANMPRARRAYANESGDRLSDPPRHLRIISHNVLHPGQSSGGSPTRRSNRQDFKQRSAHQSRSTSQLGHDAADLCDSSRRRGAGKTAASAKHRRARSGQIDIAPSPTALVKVKDKYRGSSSPATSCTADNVVAWPPSKC